MDLILLLHRPCEEWEDRGQVWTRRGLKRKRWKKKLTCSEKMGRDEQRLGQCDWREATS